MTKLNSFERKRGVDSDNVDISGAAQAVILSKAQGGADTALDDGKGIELDREQVLRTDLLDAEMFMRDRLEIHVHDAASEADAGFAEVTVNGKYECLVRGETKVISRAHVAALANAKALRIVQTKIVGPDGSMGYQERAVLHLMYPFSVIHDPNPKLGVPWLRQLLKNPG